MIFEGNFSPYPGCQMSNRTFNLDIKLASEIPKLSFDCRHPKWGFWTDKVHRNKFARFICNDLNAK